MCMNLLEGSSVTCGSKTVGISSPWCEHARAFLPSRADNYQAKRVRFSRGPNEVPRACLMRPQEVFQLCSTSGCPIILPRKGPLLAGSVVGAESAWGLRCSMRLLWDGVRSGCYAGQHTVLRLACGFFSKLVGTWVRLPLPPPDLCT